MEGYLSLQLDTAASCAMIEQLLMCCLRQRGIPIWLVFGLHPSSSLGSSVSGVSVALFVGLVMCEVVRVVSFALYSLRTSRKQEGHARLCAEKGSGRKG